MNNGTTSNSSIIHSCSIFMFIKHVHTFFLINRWSHVTLVLSQHDVILWSVTIPLSSFSQFELLCRYMFTHGEVPLNHVLSSSMCSFVALKKAATGKLCSLILLCCDSHVTKPQGKS